MKQDLEKPIFVIDTKPRVRNYPERHINIPHFRERPPSSDPSYYDWHYLFCDFCVHQSKLEQAKILEKEIWEAFKNNDLKKTEKIFEELLLLRSVPFEKRSIEEKWSHMMEQLPGDIGGPNKKEIAKILSKQCYGNVLEAMCGFNSYLLPSRKRIVFALDFCKEALERYKYPDRTRILLNLNHINRNNKIKFFEDGQFDAITVCFGIQYIEHPVYLFREFHRLLSKNGSLYLVENPRQHYEDMYCRWFKPKQHISWLGQAFDNVECRELPIAEEWELKHGGHYYLFKATKS